MSNLVRTKQWLVGNSLSVADIAVASQLSLLKFPPSSGKLAGKGCKGFNDNPKLDRLFEWRDHFDINLMQANPAIN